MEILTPSDYESGSRKRQRRSGRPCSACKQRKSRCVLKDGESQCVHCELRGSACVFEPGELVRSYIIQPSNVAVPNPIHLAAQKPTSENPQEQLEADADIVSIPVSHRPTDDGGSSATAISGPEGSSDSSALGLSQSRFAELYGLGSDMEPILMRHRPYDPRTQEFSLETHSIRRVLDLDGDQVAYPLTFHVVSDEKAIDSSAEAVQCAAIEACIHPHGASLVELFWRHVHPCYPLLNKEFFMDNYAKSPRRVSAALLGAIYLSAMRWWGYDPELSIKPMPDASLLRGLLQKAVTSSYHRPKLSSIQAILLLLQCQPEDPLNPDHTYAWGLTCQALAIGQCLGLHLNASNWFIPQWERNVRKRLSWALYMQDRWTALAYGRPVHIHHDDWGVLELANEDFSDCDSSSLDEERRSIGARGKLQFIHMVKLTLILTSVLSSFYSIRTCFDQDTELLYRRAQPLLDQLQAWYESIPSSLQMSIAYQRKLCFHGYLHFSYYGVTMAILRRLIRSTAMPPRCEEELLGRVRQIALQTTQNAIGFVLALRPDQLEAFWYFTSPYLYALVGSFTTLLLVTSLSSQERNFWQETLNSYLWSLRTMSKSSEPMRYAVNRLEGAILRGLEHALAVNLNEPLDSNVSPMVVTDFGNEVFEYTDFGDWDLAVGGNGAFDILGSIQLDTNALTTHGSMTNG
ncbi:hypothetical protein GQ53DRAFT_48780 [Thozetella sp. PMI_491]|nr:hypothetical protein GQ53DRAFT_48780 [Thozetella sp. PMI_491]